MPKEFSLFDDKTAENLRESSHACYSNGIELLEEANILYDHERYARAVSLAILAEEEFAKGLVLIDCSSHKRWDNIIYQALKKHESKHVIASAMAKLIDIIRKKSATTNNTLFPRPLEFKDLQKDRVLKDEILVEEKKELKRRKKDKRKQDAQFVAINKNGSTSKQPKLLFVKRDAQIHIDTAVKTRAALELIYGKRAYDDPLFRSDHCFYMGMANELTLGHKSGIAVAMKYMFLREKEFALDVATVEMYTSDDTQINIFEPDTLNNEQKIKLAKLYKAYDAPNQIRDEMRELGLRDTTYLDEVEKLITDYAHK